MRRWLPGAMVNPETGSSALTDDYLNEMPFGSGFDFDSGALLPFTFPEQKR